MFFILNFYSITKSIAQVTVNTQATSYKTITQSNSEYDNKTINTNLAVGAIEGKFEVSLTGGASYRVKPDLPPGIKAMMPNIEVMYSSQAGNTILGAGWILSGLSSITRKGKDHFHDGKIEDFKFTGDDYFSLDGNILVPYGSSGQYRTLKETYNVVTINWGYNGYADCPNSFRVETKDGWIMEYGATADAKLLTKSGKNGNSQPNVLTWKVNKITDKHGNYILFNYKNIAPTATSTPTHVIDEISYTHNDALSTAVINYVKFKYSVRQDINSGYIQGDEYLENYVLTAIESYSGTTLYGKLVMDYSYDHNSSVINSIRKFNKANEELNKTSFKHEEFNLDSKLQNISPKSSNNEKIDARRYADFNGDGFSDYLTSEKFHDPTNNKFYVNKQEIYLNNGNGTFTLTKTITNVNEITKEFIKNPISYFNNIIDINGDNIQDIIFFKMNNGSQKIIQYYIVSWNTQTNKFVETQKDIISSSISDIFPSYVPYYDVNPDYETTSQDLDVTPSGKNWMMTGDYDGDGKTEILMNLKFDLYEVYTNPQTGNIYNQNFTNVIQFIMNPYNLSNAPLDKIIIPSSIISSDMISNIDINGDGIQEILDFDNKSLYEYNKLTKSFVLKNSNLSIPGNLESVEFGDFNGDRKTDILYYDKFQLGWELNTSVLYNMNQNYNIYYSNGFDFLPPSQNLNSPPILINFSDCNDNRDPNDPNSFSLFSYNIYRKLVVTDFNYDGKSDIFEFIKIEQLNNCIIPHYQYSRAYFSNGKSFDLHNLNTLNDIFNTENDVKIGDINGDGYPDIFNLYQGNKSANGNNNTVFITNPPFNSFTSFNTSKLMKGIKNGYNNEIEITTSPLTLLHYSSTYRANTFPQAYNFVIPMRVVIGYQSNDGIGGVQNSSSFYYKNLIFDFQSGFKGFEEVFQQNSSLRGFSRTINTYNNTYKTLYTSKTETGIDNLGNLEILMSKTNTFDFKEYTNTTIGIGSKRYIELPLTSSSQNFQNGAISNTIYNYDSKANEYRLMSKNSTINSNLATENTQFTNYIKAGSIFENKPQTIISTITRLGKPSLTSETQYDYNSTTGDIYQEIVSKGKDCETTINYDHDAVGNVIKKITLPTGPLATSSTTARVEETVYDNSKRFVEKTKNIMGQITKTTLYESSTGNPTESTDINGERTIFEYDNWNKLIKTEIPVKAISSNISFEWEINPPFKLFKKTTTSSGASDVIAHYDILGRETLMESKGRFNKDMMKVKSYNTNGAIDYETNNYYITETPLQTYTNYDIYGRPVTITNNNETSTIEYKYNGATTTSVVSVSHGLTKEVFYDPTGIKTKVTDVNGEEIEYEYNSAGQLLNTKIAGHQKIEYKYNSCGQLESQEDNSNGLLTFAYDEWGQLKSKKTARNKVESYVYDIYGRKTEQTNPEGVTSYYYVPFNEDGRNQLRKSFTQATDPSENVYENYTYNSSGLVTSSSKTIGNINMGVKYTYDNQFNHILEKQYSSGIKLEYSYDMNHNLEKVESNGQLIYELNDVNSFDKPLQYKLGNNSVTNKGYDQNFPVQYTTVLTSNTIGSSMILDYTVNFDKISGNVMSRKTDRTFVSPSGVSSTSFPEDFQYGGDVLISSSSNTLPLYPCKDIWYDGYGNIDAKYDVGVYNYDVSATKNQVIEIEYPENISAHTQMLSYTSFEQPNDIFEDIHKLHYAYSDNQQRIRGIWYDNTPSTRTGPPPIKRLRYYFGDMEINVEKDPNISGQFNADYIHYVYGIDGQMVSIIKNKVNQFNITTATSYIAENLTAPTTDPSYITPPGSQTDYYFTYTDHLGSIQVVTDINNDVISERHYDPWGRYLDAYTGAGLTASASPSWLYRGYTGHEHLDEFVLINMNGRLYDPVVAKFLSTDQFISDPERALAYNRYAYGLNNPLKYTDPDGENPFLGAVILGAAISGGMYFANVIIFNEQFELSKFGQALLVGAISGAVSFGVGEIVTTAYGIGFTLEKLIVSSLLHAGTQSYSNLISNSMLGRDISPDELGISFLTSSISSFVAGGSSKILGIGSKTMGDIAHSGISGGLASVTAWLTGGDPIKAFTTSTIISLTNYALHKSAETLDVERKYSDKEFKEYIAKLIEEQELCSDIMSNVFDGKQAPTTITALLLIIKSNPHLTVPAILGYLSAKGSDYFIGENIKSLNTILNNYNNLHSVYSNTKSGVYTISNTSSPIGHKEVFNTVYFYDNYYKKFLGLIQTGL